MRIRYMLATMALANCAHGGGDNGAPPTPNGPSAPVSTAAPDPTSAPASTIDAGSVDSGPSEHFFTEQEAALIVQENPHIFVDNESVTLHVGKRVPGSRGVPFRVTELKAKLLSLPDSSWPHGKVIVLQTDSRPFTADGIANFEACQKTLRELGIRVLRAGN